MRSWPTIVALTAMVVTSWSVGAAAQVDDRASRPQRNTEERPFGGPPPNQRAFKPKKDSSTCKTTYGSCRLDKALPAGSACTCPPSETGKVE